MLSAMAIPKPPPLLISPMTLICPKCKARPGQSCLTPVGSALEAVHLQRIEAAAAKDAAAARKSR
jgi:hypothetical protein